MTDVDTLHQSRSLPPLLLALVCVVIYANGLRGDFVYDDVSVTVEANPFLAGLVGWREVLAWDRPVREFTYLLDHILWGDRPFGYHLQNLAWHILNVLLFWAVLREVGVERWRACVPALLFAIHPINTESVTWISGRKELLCLFFELSALWLFLRYLRPGAWPHAYAAAIVMCLVLGLLSKQVAVVLPAVLVAAAWCQGGVFTLRRPRVWVLLLVLGGVTLLLALTSLRGIEVVREAAERGTYYDPAARHLKLDHPVLTALAVWFRALRLLIVPYPLVLERSIEPVHGWADPRWMAGAVSLLLFGALFWRSRNQPFITFAVAWVFLTWLPTSGIVPIAYLLADRYLYIPCVGFCMLAGHFLNRLLEHRLLSVRRVSVAAVTLVVIAYTLVTVDRNRDWANEISLWTSAARHEASNPKVHFNLGNAYETEGVRDLAEKEWKLALSLRPEYAEVHVNLGRLYQTRGELDLAARHYKAALDLSPDFGVAQFNLALLEEERGNLQQAVHLMRAAAIHIKGKRDTPQKKALAYRELGRLLLESNRPQEALDAVKKSLGYVPTDREAGRLLSIIQSRLGSTR